MQLTQFTDYALRVLIFLGVKGRDATVGEIVDSYGISRNHLTKVVHKLAQLGYIHSTRGKGGGIRLARLPQDINVGTLVLATEPHFDLVECFNAGSSLCPLTSACRLKNILGEAQRSFIEALSRHSLAELVENKDALVGLFAARTTPIKPQPAPAASF